MLLLDHRIGSGDLELPLRQLGLPVDVVTLDFADAAFLGHGPDGPDTVQVGIEIKKIRDLINSIDGGRLAGHQLPGLLRQYDVVYLVVEGLWRPGRDGVLELPKGGSWDALTLGTRRFMYREVDNALTTLETKAGVRLRRSGTRDETARVLWDLYHWWRDKEWHQHRSHLQLRHGGDAALLIEPPLRRRVAAELPGIGFDRSGAVAAHFATTLEMVNADEREWRRIKGIGKTLATRIVQTIGRE